MTRLHSPFQTVMQRRVVPAFMIVISCGILLSPLMPPAAPVQVLAAAAVILLITGAVCHRVYQILVSPATKSVVCENGALHVRRHGQEVSNPLSSITFIPPPVFPA